MGKLHLTLIGNPVLRKAANEVDREELQEHEFKKLVKEMVHAMHEWEGVGLAANQAGIGMQLCVLECKKNPRYPKVEGFPLEIWINPKIMDYSQDQEEDWEGCLSIPGYQGLVPRSKTVTIEALNTDGEKVRKTISGFHARVIQHEVDHLNGLVYMDRMLDLKQWIHLKEFNKLFHEHQKDREA